LSPRTEGLSSATLLALTYHCLNSLLQLSPYLPPITSSLRLCRTSATFKVESFVDFPCDSSIRTSRFREEDCRVFSPLSVQRIERCLRILLDQAYPRFAPGEVKYHYKLSLVSSFTDPPYPWNESTPYPLLLPFEDPGRAL